jgi:hypothetical protein
VSGRHQELALRVRCEREQVGIAGASAGRHGLRGGGHRALEVAGSLPAEHLGEQQVPAFGAVVLVLEQALGPPQPATTAAQVAAHERLHADPEGAARGPAHRAGLEMAGVGPLECREVLLVAPDHVQRGRQALEIVGVERLLRIGLGQRLGRSRPPAGGVRRAAALEGVRPLHATDGTWDPGAP